MGKMGKQDGRPRKSLGNPLNMLKNFKARGKKLGTVGSPETQFFFILGRIRKWTVHLSCWQCFVTTVGCTSIVYTCSLINNRKTKVGLNNV